MTRFGALGLLGLVATLALSRSAIIADPPADTSPAAAAPEVFIGPLRYGGDEDFPPYEWLDEHGVAHGFQVDLIRELAQRLNVDVDVRLGPWHEIYADFLAGNIDVVSMADRPERHDIAEFCEPHTALVSEVFVRKGSPKLTRVEDLVGKNVIVEREALAAHVASKSLPWVKLVQVDSQTDALKLLASGQGDAAVVTQANGRAIIQREQLDNLRSTGPVVLMSNYSFCTRKGEVALRNLLNDTLNSIKLEEQYGKLYAKWLGRPDRALLMQRLLKWAAIVGLPLLGLLAAWALWTQTLRAQVAQRTRSLHEELQAKHRAEGEVRLLLNELDHRVRNLLTSIVSLAEQQPAGDRPSARFRSDLVGRVRAMATAHGAMRSCNDHPLTLDGAIRTLARQFGPSLHERIQRDGPDLSLPSEQATPLCMVLHELLSNAVRHGALSVPGGIIAIQTGQRAEGFEIRWSEDGAGKKPCEVRAGFGISLMEGLVVYQLHGRFNLHMTSQGLEVELLIPDVRMNKRDVPEGPATHRQVTGELAS